MAVQEHDGASGLWGAQVCQGANSMEVALQAIRTILVDSTEPPDMTCVARSGNVEFWRADFGNDTRMEGGASVIPYQWRRPEEMPKGVSGTGQTSRVFNFGVWARGGRGSIFPLRRGPILQSARYITSLQNATNMSTLTVVIQTGVITDGFLSRVLESVKDLDNNFFRKFFLDSNDILCYQRPEDVRARVCVPGTSREAVLRATHGDSGLAGRPGIDQTYAAVSYAYYWPNLLANVAHFVRALHPKVQINCVWV